MNETTASSRASLLISRGEVPNKDSEVEQLNGRRIARLEGELMIANVELNRAKVRNVGEQPVERERRNMPHDIGNLSKTAGPAVHVRWHQVSRSA